MNQLSIQVEPIYQKSYSSNPVYLGLEIILEFPNRIKKELESFLQSYGFSKSITATNVYSLTLLNISKSYHDYLLTKLQEAFNQYAYL
jgi:hypothetical protein